MLEKELISVLLELLSKDNVDELFKFEKENKEFFERNLLPRPKGYYNYSEFKKLMDDIMLEQKDRKCFMHVIRNEEKEIIGRINLHSENMINYELGYRLEKDSQGLGYGTLAIKELLNLAFNKYRITNIFAETSSMNIASQKALLKNGFKFTKEEKEVVVINGELIDGYVYEIINNGYAL